MRDMVVDTIAFTNTQNVSVSIKDMREFPEYTLKEEVGIIDGDTIDEIATRRTVYGENTEDMTYKIVDYNIEKIYESKFDLKKLKTLKIPNV